MTSKSPYPDIIVPDIDLWSFLFQRQNRPFPDSHVILTDAQTGRRYTFDDLRKLSLNFGSRLQERLDWRKGDVLTIFTMNAIDIPPIVWGTVAIGGVVSPLNPNFSSTELVHYLKTSQAKAIVTQKSQYAKVAQAAEGAGLPKDRIIVIDDDDNASGDKIWQPDPYLIPDYKFDSLHKSPITRPKEELAFLVFSSGTTGLPKGVMLSHVNIVANLLQMEVVDAGFLDSKDRALAFLPFFHIYGITCLINYGLFLGMSTYVMPRFDLEACCKVVQNQKITYVYIVPPAVLQMVQNPIVEKYDLSSIRLFNSAAAPLPMELIKALRTKLGLSIRQQYGMSECSPCTHSQTKREGDEYPGAVGRLVSNMVAKYVPIAGEEVKPGRMEGELWVKGPNVFLGYLNNPTATNESFSEDGYYKTGDVGYEDAYGNFVITDRIKELIKYNGFQVPPAELEALILGHPAVADVAVVGIPSGKAGSELPRAYIKVKEDSRANHKTADDIVEFVRSKVAPYKQLRGGVHFIDAIPRNPSGKILRRELKKLYANKL
ncbi:putative 4-coumarate--CoA ligase 1 [Talaromyces pinophilus]|nr:putative 4-coumarate--CoA ligase 1 [Talaromyces pinophilus]